MSAKLLTVQQQLDSSRTVGVAVGSGEVNTTSSGSSSDGRSMEQLWEVIRSVFEGVDTMQ
jgi:hypothetical protein